MHRHHERAGSLFIFAQMELGAFDWFPCLCEFGEFAPGSINIAVVTERSGKIGRASGDKKNPCSRGVAIGVAALGQQAFRHARVEQQLQPARAAIKIGRESGGVKAVFFGEPFEDAGIGTNKQHA